MIPAVRSDDLRAVGVSREAGAGGNLTKSNNEIQGMEPYDYLLKYFSNQLFISAWFSGVIFKLLYISLRLTLEFSS